MLRMGRDTKSLNLSGNELSQVPVEILNFFIKWDLISVNLSDNLIPSLQELHRVSSKIEKLWVEGNPLCKDLDPLSYAKQISMKFPRLKELDGVKLNEHGFILPYVRNYLDDSDKKTKMTTEKFLSLYFAHFDRMPRRIDNFYDADASLTISSNFTEVEEQGLLHIANHSRNLLHSQGRSLVHANNKVYKTKPAIALVFQYFPTTKHDPCTFTVDTIKHNESVLKKSITIIVDGVYKEVPVEPNAVEKIFEFRRTFVFQCNVKPNTYSEYLIVNEMFYIRFATKDMISRSFLSPRSTNLLALIHPDEEDIDTICSVFMHLTQLKRNEVEQRMRANDWDVQRALRNFMYDLKRHKIPPANFVVEDSSDCSFLANEGIEC